MARTTRLDILIVERGIIESREKAKRMIMAGEVFVDGQMVAKADHKTKPESVVTLKTHEKYVSRGGLKLEAALAEFHLDVSGKICLDVGASTGGFTDCLLQHGAKKVFAIDVGHGQLSWKLQQDARVVSRENINARNLESEQFDLPLEFSCVDVSFISLKKILRPLFNKIVAGADTVVLIKPQFEAGREVMDRCRGVLKDRDIQDQIAQDIRGFAQDTGFNVIGLMDSPIFGAEGNREFLIGLRKK
ncbi:MAG: TlyA family RNA methyltransferase [Verrucomicrobiota bacterium]|mgnify:CR=1 FL=1|nr:TlyA family RNA methyltransferase [Verrucomicrobiota bacterium]